MVSARTANILIVDDHAVVREGLRALLGQETGLSVVGEASDAASALMLLSEERRVDLVVVDLSLGGEDGLDLVARIRREHPSLGILVLSMHPEEVFAARSKKAGANGYIMKHEATGKLLTALREVFAGRPFFSESAFANQSEGALVKRRLGPLTSREIEVFRLLGDGLDTWHIAKVLGISPKTVDTHRAHIKEKLGLRNVTQLVVAAATWVQRGEIPERNSKPDK